MKVFVALTVLNLQNLDNPVPKKGGRPAGRYQVGIKQPCHRTTVPHMKTIQELDNELPMPDLSHILRR
jgi:hypothetical protein